MSRRGHVGSMMVFGGLLLWTSQVSASLFEPVGDEQLVCEATDIVQGQVLETRSAWDDQHVAIWTTATVQIQEVVNGRLSRGGVIQVKEVGGTVGDYTIKAHDFPTFQKGEEVVVLLQPWDDGSGTYRVWGYGRGMFSVVRQEGRPATTLRHDVVESGRPTLHTDKVSPTNLLSDLNRELGALARQCGSRRGRP